MIPAARSGCRSAPARTAPARHVGRRRDRGAGVGIGHGREGLEAAVRERAPASALDLCAGVVADVHRFAAGAEQSDDITLMVVRWHGAGA